MSANFSNHDLRNRSFKGQKLSGANFQNSDLRGCDFSHAQLIGANLQNIRTGRTLKQVLPIGILTILVALPLFDVTSRLIFAALGQTAEDAGWTYVLVLQGVLGIAGIGDDKSIASRAIAAAASGALLGFFYGGSWTQNDPRFAAIGATIVGLLAAAASLKNHRGVTLALTTARAIARYGFAFLIATIAINHLSTQNPWGLLWSFLSMLYIQLTITALLSLVRQFRRIGGTCFQGANLTQATFDHAKLSPSTDFSNAVGMKFGARVGK
jgi:Pentapeptide repeats (8 copies)